MRQMTTLLALLVITAAPAAASSEEAWAEFAEKMSAECLKAAAALLEAAEVAVDPFGSESFGLAVLTGKARGADAHVSYICVMDKQGGRVELGSELPDDLLTVAIP